MIDFLYNLIFGNTFGIEYVGSWWQILAMAVASGISARSEAKQADKNLKNSGIEDRKTLAFKYDMDDYLTQKDKYQRAKGLENFAAWSNLDKYAPEGYTGTVNPLEKPVKPKPEQY